MIVILILAFCECHVAKDLNAVYCILQVLSCNLTYCAPLTNRAPRRLCSNIEHRIAMKTPTERIIGPSGGPSGGRPITHHLRKSVPASLTYVLRTEHTTFIPYCVLLQYAAPTRQSYFLSAQGQPSVALLVSFTGESVLVGWWAGVGLGPLQQGVL